MFSLFTSKIAFVIGTLPKVDSAIRCFYVCGLMIMETRSNFHGV